MLLICGTKKKERKEPRITTTQAVFQASLYVHFGRSLKEMLDGKGKMCIDSKNLERKKKRMLTSGHVGPRLQNLIYANHIIIEWCLQNRSPSHKGLDAKSYIKMRNYKNIN